MIARLTEVQAKVMCCGSGSPAEIPPLNHQDPLPQSYGLQPTANRLPLLVASYDMQWDTVGLFYPRTSRGSRI